MSKIRDILCFIILGVSLAIFIYIGLINKAHADQISLQSGGLINNLDTYYLNYDYKVQYQHGDDKYIFLQARKMGACTAYCESEYQALGLGFGVRGDFGWIKPFVQGGYYFMRNTFGVRSHSEAIYYYMKSRFGAPPKTVSYEIKNSDGIGFTLGADFPYSKHWGFKASVSSLNYKENIIMRFTDDPSSLNLWWDPRRRQPITLNFGIYGEF